MVKRATVTALGLLLLLAVALPAAAGAASARHFVTSFGNFTNPRNVTVDQSNGDVYVLDVGAKTITRFDKNLVAKKFTGLNTNVIDGAGLQTCPGTPSSSCDQTPFNGFNFDAASGGAPQVAIDSSGSPLTKGDIYVADTLHRVVAVFASTGVYLGLLSRTGVAGSFFSNVYGVAVDPAGALYVSSALEKIHKYVPSANPPTNADFSLDFSSPRPGPLAAGAGATAGSLFVNKRTEAVSKLNSSGVSQYELSSAAGQGVAVDPASGHVYVATGAEAIEYDASGVAPVVVESFGAPQVTTATSVAVDATSGRAYIADAATGKVDVYAPPAAVTAPTIVLGPYAPRSATSVSVSGFIDADRVIATYYFEYGAADCASGPCTSVPLSHDAIPGKGFGSLRVAQTISGLQPETTYHYRLLATNAGGSSVSQDGTFTTLATGLSGTCPNAARRAEQRVSILADCRAYELVSAIPAGERNGMEVLLNTERVRTAVDGGAFSFSSMGGAADLQGLPFTGDYMGIRDPAGGWGVHGLTPKQESSLPTFVLGGREAGYRGEFTPDLGKAVFLSSLALNDEGPNVKSIFNLYRREDLRTPGAGTFRLLSDAVTPQTPWQAAEPLGEDQEWPRYIGASTDLAKVVFESKRNLTADSAALPAGSRLYKWADGALRMVGVLPASEGGGLTVARGGSGYGTYVSRAVSADGSRVLFTTPPYGTNETGGRLYLRDDNGTATVGDDTSVKVSASEKTNGAGVGGTDARGAQAAFYADASVDMDAVFFRSTEALTNDAPEDNGLKLYRYRPEAPADARLTLLSVDQNSADGVNDGTDGVVGISRDGSYVYFVASNQLVADRPPSAGSRIYLWHAGAVRQVGAINSGEELNRIVAAGTEAWQSPGGRWSRVSPDGEHLVFISEGSGELAGYDHGITCPANTSNRCKEVYLYSAPTAAGGERLQCASCNRIGLAASGDADFNEREATSLLSNFVVGSTYLNHALSADGRYVFFTSSERLSAYDENEKPDAYEFDSTTGQISMLSAGRAGAASYFLDAGEDGSDAFFLTRSQLLGGDGNDVTDVYDARVGGGFAEPAPPAPPCDSTPACRPATAAAAADPYLESLKAPPATRRKAHHKRRHRAKKHHAHHRGQERGARHG